MGVLGYLKRKAKRVPDYVARKAHDLPSLPGLLLDDMLEELEELLRDQFGDRQFSVPDLIGYLRRKQRELL